MCFACGIRARIGSIALPPTYGESLPEPMIQVSPVVSGPDIQMDADHDQTRQALRPETHNLLGPGNRYSFRSVVTAFLPVNPSF